MRLRVLALLFCLLLLSGCGPAENASPSVPQNPESQSAPETKPGTEAETGPETETEAKPETRPEAAPGNLFETIPASYMFCSGAGAWSTDLTIAPDGTFTGLYLDADMGDSDPEKYPGGTRYVCNFSGQFTQPEKVDDTTYFMQIESLELSHPADESEEYADECRYVYTGPYGLESAEELRIYLPDAPTAELPEGVLRAARGPYDWEETEQGTLGLYVIYNVEEDLGFVEYPRVTKE